MLSFSFPASSATAGGFLFFFLSYMPYFFLASRYADMNAGSKNLASLLSNVAMAFGCQVIAAYEGTGIINDMSFDKVLFFLLIYSI